MNAIRLGMACATLLGLAACGSGSGSAALTPSDLASIQAVLSAADIAVTEAHAIRCAPEVSKGIACPLNPAETAAENAIAAATAAVNTYVAAPTAVNAAAINSKLSDVTSKTTAAKTSG